MADANEMDLGKFSRWYSQSGTPVVRARGEFDAVNHSYTLHLEQYTPPTPDQKEKLPLTIPLAVGLLDADGKEMELHMSSGDEPPLGSRTRVLILENDRQSFTFNGIESEPVPSLLRGYSAPVKLEFDYSDGELATLMAHDSDTFVRWEASQLLAKNAIFAQLERLAAGQEARLPDALTEAVSSMLADTESDPALLGEALLLPGEEYLAELMEVVDVEGIHNAREFIRRQLAKALQEEFHRRYESLVSHQPYTNSPDAIGRRKLKNVCLAYLATCDGGDELAESQFNGSDNMTDTLAGLQALVFENSPRAAAALNAFESRWRNDALVMDKWFALQASRPSADTVGGLAGLMEHPAFSMTNPNKVRALVGVFAGANPMGFHAADGRGYEFVAEQAIALDSINPQVAARLVSAFNGWKRYDPERQALMREQLKRILAKGTLSPDVSEIVGSSLSG
jgi:aminopeptidase N